MVGSVETSRKKTIEVAKTDIQKQSTETTETVYRNNRNKQTETTETSKPKQDKSLVPQASQPVSEKNDYELETVYEATETTKILSVPSEDISKWKKYASTYFKRSLKEVPENWTEGKKKVSLKAIKENREKYKSYKNLLETSGVKVKPIDAEKRLIFVE